MSNSTYKEVPSNGGKKAVDLVSTSDALVITKLSAAAYSLGIDQSKINVGSAASIVATYAAGETISALQSVYYDINTDRIYKADKNNLIKASVLGIAVSSGLEGEDIRVIQYGLLTDAAFNFAPAELAFLDDNGILSTIAPTTGYLTRLGRAINENTLLVLIESPITL